MIFVVLFHIGENNRLMFIKAFPNLVSQLQHNIISVSTNCWSERLVSKETYTSILQLNTTSELKTTNLLMNINQTISQDPNAMDKFCCILTKIGDYDNLVKDLRSIKQA